MSSFHKASVLLATYLIAKAISSPTDTLTPRDTSWCTFYTENFCENRSGSDDYNVSNDGIFQNGGPYFKCRATDEFSLISYPPGDSGGTTPNHCYVFPADEADFQCNHLDDYGFTTGDGGYYRLSWEKTCPSISERRDDSNETSELITKRDSGWLTFYDDPACEQQSGGDSYSVDNQGCFENGGAYARYDGDNFDWHIEQWTGTDNYACAVTMEHCVTVSSFITTAPDSGNPCVHLDDAGLSSGFGSYKIAGAGCP